jgi:hypothetical protein
MTNDPNPFGMTAWVTNPNTEESDAELKVWHTVTYHTVVNDLNVKTETQIFAECPMDAIKQLTQQFNNHGPIILYQDSDTISGREYLCHDSVHPMRFESEKNALSYLQSQGIDADNTYTLAKQYGIHIERQSDITH